MTVQEHVVAHQGFLECRTHECISGAGDSQDGEVDVKEGEIQKERNSNETNSASREMPPEIVLELSG